MEQKKRVGYEVSVVVSGDRSHIFCVDGTGKIRGYYVDGFRHYLSDWELWADHEGLGTMTGEFKRGGRVSAFDREGTILKRDGYRIHNLRVMDAKEVDIDKMTSDPYIAGLDKPIWKPGALN